MCKNKSEPKMHPYHFLEKLFHDITHLVINNQSNEVCQNRVSFGHSGSGIDDRAWGNQGNYWLVADHVQF